MSRKNEEPKGSSGVTFRVPDFLGEDGVVYSDIELLVELDSDIRDAVQLVKTLERPLTERKSVEPRNGKSSDPVTR